MEKIEFTTPIIDIVDLTSNDILTDSQYTYGDEEFFQDPADKSWNW